MVMMGEQPVPSTILCLKDRDLLVLRVFQPSDKEPVNIGRSQELRQTLPPGSSPSR